MANRTVVDELNFVVEIFKPTTVVEQRIQK